MCDRGVAVVTSVRSCRIVATNAPVLPGVIAPGHGTFQFAFTNLTGATFTVVASTNVALPLNSGSDVGPAAELPPGSVQFQFSDPAATNHVQQFDRVSSP